MALMYPDRPPAPGPGRKAEGALFHALKTQLPGDFHVYYGFRFIEDSEAREGEVDFLVLHRTLGLLGLECKGFGVKRTAPGDWVRTLEGGKEETLAKSPFEQAEGNIHTLVKAIKPKLEHQLSWKGTFPMPYGHAVAFPLTELTEGRLPAEAPREIVLDCRDMARVGTRIQEAMRFWARTRPTGVASLDEKDFDRFRRHILLPKLKFALAPAADLATREGAFVQLTEEQAWVADALFENRLFRVVGGAGTGKTLMALEVARRLAELGLKTLVLCFNRALAMRLDEAVRSWGLDPTQARATYFHRLCEEAFHVMGRPFAEPEETEERSAFYNHHAPELLSEALLRGAVPRWDAIVIDEGQDFAASWWHLVEAHLSDSEHGRRFIFYDPYQGVFGRECSVPPYPVLRLKKGVRSTRQITRFAASLGDPELVPHPQCPEGGPVETYVVPTGEECKKTVSRVLRDLIRNQGFRPDQIIILSPHRLEHSSLAGLDEVDGTPLKGFPCAAEGVLQHATISGFKGLESDAVVLIDVNSADPRSDSSAQYVASSRAKHFLAVVERAVG